MNFNQKDRHEFEDKNEGGRETKNDYGKDQNY
jgi:hypothetical protein